jgi:hypothetical protein
MSVTINNLDGNATVERNLRGIKVRSGNRIDQFKTQLRTSGILTAENLPKVTHSNIGKGIEVISNLLDEKTFEVTLHIIAGLNDTDPPLDVQIFAVVTHAHLVRAADISAAYATDEFKHEYLGESVDAATKHLNLEVTFPKGAKPPVYKMAFYFASETMATEQLKKVTAQVDESAADLAAICISDPPPGYTYALYWLGTK